MSVGAGSNRFLFIDGLRGLAAFAVMFSHLAPAELWNWTDRTFTADVKPQHLLGSLGVRIFFAISGFVIAHCLVGVRVTPRFAANFMLRRSIRLDPPYWATILVAAAVGWMIASYFGGRFQLPSAGAFLSHMVYLYPFFGYEPIVGVFWTLVLEVQFYLAFLFVVFAAQRLAGDGPRSPRRFGRWLGGLLLGTAMVSEACRLAPFPWFLNFWHEFAIGAVVCLYRSRTINIVPLAVLLAFKLGALVHQPEFDRAVTLFTGAALTAAVFSGGIVHWLSFRPIQFLGAISYSLYLIHPVIGLRVLRIRHHVELPGGSVLWSLLSMVVSIAAAWIMWRYVERTSIALAKRFRPTETAAYPPTTPEMGVSGRSKQAMGSPNIALGR